MFSACGIFVNDGPWDLTLGLGVAGQTIDKDVVVLFPNQSSLDNTQYLKIWTMDPARLRGDDFISGDVVPESDPLQIKLPLPENTALRNMPDKQVIFFVEARDTNVALLRGYAIARARKKLGITILLTCICQPVPGICAAQDEIPGNSKDDDCDGMTDECDPQKNDCEDDNPCTQNFCIDGKCLYSKLDDGALCNDMDPCTVGDTCQDGQCEGTEKDCSQYSYATCHEGVCNESTGACEPSPVINGTDCDDNLFCTVDDACLDGVCTGQPRDCNDDNFCTTDRCDESSDKCSNALQPIPGAEIMGDPSCSNGVDDDCDGYTDEQDPNCNSCDSDSQCDDSNPCTENKCTDGECNNPPKNDNSPCDDGVFCNGGDYCVGGSCSGHGGDPCPGPDGDSNCTESCDEENDNCNSLDPDGSPCDDGLYCTVSDSCQSGTCSGVDRDCSDSYDCTNDACDEQSVSCAHTPISDPGTEGPVGDITCDNDRDDDCDGLTDTDDYDCLCQASASSEDPDLCNNQIDDDCDGVSDSNDPDCGCVPDCTDKVCGDDGCGGQCGSDCSDGLSCVHGLCLAMNWVTIVGGTYTMGKDGNLHTSPAHQVTVPSFQITKTEITQALYRHCYDQGVCSAPNPYDQFDRPRCNWGNTDHDNYPINCLDWNQAKDFCEWAGGKLPSEAEWEFAARSRGQDNTYPWGEDEPTCDYAIMYTNYPSTHCCEYICGTRQVCSRTQGNTEQGLCDMAGNVQEWTADWWHFGYDGTPTDGSAYIGYPYETSRTVRGGSFNIAYHHLECTERINFGKDSRTDYTGFRCTRN